MFIWILVVVVLAVFWVYNWAELGGRMKGRNLWMVLGWSAVSLIVWQVSLETLKLNQMLSFMFLLLVLMVGYYQLKISNPKLAPLHKKSHPKKKRSRKHR